MENQHRAINGYRDLTQNEINLMNDIKEHGRKLGDLISMLKSNNGLDQRWISIGQTDLQKGIMALVRAVAKPDSF